MIIIITKRLSITAYIFFLIGISVSGANAQDNPPTLAEQIEFMSMKNSIQLKGLEKAISDFADSLTVPKRSLVAAQGEQNRLLLTYAVDPVDQDIKQLSPVFSKLKLRENCINPVMNAIIIGGGEIVSIYVNADEREIGRLITSRSACLGE